MQGASKVAGGSGWILAGLCLLLALVGCRGEVQEAAPGASAQEGTAKASAPAAPSAAELLLESTGVAVEAAPALGSDRIETAGAKKHERFTNTDPGLEILLLSYDDAKAAALALPKVTSWANRSKLMHKAEAMAEGAHVLLVGLEPGSEPTDDTKSVIDKLLNAFVGGASGL